MKNYLKRWIFNVSYVFVTFGYILISASASKRQGDFLQVQSPDSYLNSSQDASASNRVLSNWGEALLVNVAHPATIIGVPLIILGLLLWTILTSFADNNIRGIRSVLTSCLPLVMTSYIFLYQGQVLEFLTSFNPLTNFLTASLWGFIIIYFIYWSRKSDLELPILEFLLSATFSLLLFSYVKKPGNEVLSYYYGTVSGFLTYIFVFGLPVRK